MEAIGKAGSGARECADATGCECRRGNAWNVLWYKEAEAVASICEDFRRTRFLMAEVLSCSFELQHESFRCTLVGEPGISPVTTGACPEE